MIKRIFCFSAVAVLLLAGAAKNQEKDAFNADRHKSLNLKCDSCHKEAQPTTAASSAACLTCHISMEAVAEKTKDFEKNPHKNHLTEAMDVECTQCHQGHKADNVVCTQCHSGYKFEKKESATE